MNAHGMLAALASLAPIKTATAPTERVGKLHKLKGNPGGFGWSTTAAGTKYVVRHGTYYRADKLNLSPMKSAA